MTRRTRTSRSPARAGLRVLLIGVICLPLVLAGACVASAMIQTAVEGCYPMPMTSDQCRDPYMVLNWTDRAVIVDDVGGDGTARALATLSPHTRSVLNLYRDGGDRCQDGFGLVARDAGGSEVARLDHWCRFDTWILLDPGATTPPH